jgi:neutral ceramidase
VAMFWAGCGGDQNPLPRRTVELAKDYGKQLAAAVDEVLDRKMAPLKSSLSTQYREIDLPLSTPPTREQVESDAKSKNRYIAARAKMFVKQLDAGHSLPNSYPYPIQTWKLGDQIQFVTLGGEVVIDYALRLKTELSGKQTWVAGYTNDVMAYIPSRRVLREGGYEGAGAMVYYGLPTAWAPEVEELIVKEVHSQIEKKP